MDRGIEGFRTPRGRVAGPRTPVCALWAVSLALCGFCLEKRRILGAVDDDWLVGGSSRMLLRLSGQGRLVAGVKIAAGA
jgi:hypothetical protein